MQRALMIAGLLLVAVLVGLWALGGLAGVQAAILDSQRQAQAALAGAVRAIKGGQPGAVAGLLGGSFLYGFLHAAGPGHGKLLIGGYGMGQRVALRRLAGLALASSMAQAAVAVVLVYAVVAVLGFGREQAEGVAERLMAPLGTAMVAGVGLWLVWRGVRGVLARGKAAAHHDHDHAHHHHHDHGAVCDTCGHAHGPSLDQVEHLTNWRDAAALVAGIAMRPCSGALFLLILTWQLGIAAAGVAGVFAMGLGTAVVTVAVAGLAVWAREGALASLPGQRAALALPWIEIIAGSVVALAALTLLARGL